MHIHDVATDPGYELVQDEQAELRSACHCYARAT